MRNFSPAGYAKQLAEAYPKTKEFVVEVVDNDGALTIHVENVDGITIGMFDSGLDGNADPTELNELAGQLVVELRKLGRTAAFHVEETQYNYDMTRDEFVENPTGEETGDITGNRVFVFYEDDKPRFRVEIDDFGHVLAALNRLVQKIVPTFVFPVTNKV